MSTHPPDDFGEIVVTVHPQPGYVGRPCVYCGESPPVCYGAELFVNCTGPVRSSDRWWEELRRDCSPSYDNGDRAEDTEAGRANDSGNAFYTQDGV